MAFVARHMIFLALMIVLVMEGEADSLAYNQQMNKFILHVENGDTADPVTYEYLKQMTFPDRQNFMFAPLTRDDRYLIDRDGQEYVVCDYIDNNVSQVNRKRCYRKAQGSRPICAVRVVFPPWNKDETFISSGCGFIDIEAMHECSTKCHLKRSIHPWMTNNEETTVQRCCCHGTSCNRDIKSILQEAVEHQTDTPRNEIKLMEDLKERYINAKAKN